MDLGDSVVITGGGWTRTTGKLVTQYFEDGSHKELKQLNHARDSHGCSYYVDSNQNKVN